MKRLTLLFAFCAAVFAANAQTIHWITLFDTRDSKIGKAEVYTHTYFYSRFVNVVNAALAEKGYYSDIHDYYDVATNPENCKRAVENLEITDENDIIIFYYSGHGGRPDVDKEDINKHPFPQMCLGQSSDDKMIPLEWVHNKLKQKGAKLVITVGSCCNSTDPGVTPKTEPKFAANYQCASLAKNQVEAIQKMFTEYSGDIITTEASPTQYGWVGLFFNGNFHIYGGGVITTFEDYTAQRNYNLEEFFKKVNKNVTEEAYARYQKVLNPVTWFNVRYVGKQNDNHREQPIDFNVNDNVIVNNNGRTEEKNNELSQYLDYIADGNINIMNRDVQAQKLKRLCSAGTMVKILSQDADNVIDKENISDFCDRISASDMLMKVVPVDVKLTQNQITEIRVREYYKR